jgi:hypothetical protein
MTDAEIELVAAELAKVGGTAWYPGRGNGPLMRVISNRYRDRARVAIEALERYRAKAEKPCEKVQDPAPHSDALQAGSVVVYRPPGDRRAYRCRVAYLDNDRAYLVPDSAPGQGWVDLTDLQLATPRSEGA